MLKELKENFKVMPWFLKKLTIVLFFLIIFIPITFIPGGTFLINGEIVPYTEFWQRGGGLIFIATGVLCPFLAFGFLKRNKFARCIPLCLVSALVVLSFILPSQLKPTQNIINIIYIFLTAWYFYFKQSVRNYFEITSTSEQSSEKIHM